MRISSRLLGPASVCRVSMQPARSWYSHIQVFAGRRQWTVTRINIKKRQGQWSCKTVYDTEQARPHKGAVMSAGANIIFSELCIHFRTHNTQSLSLLFMQPVPQYVPSTNEMLSHPTRQSRSLARSCLVRGNCIAVRQEYSQVKALFGCSTAEYSYSYSYDSTNPLQENLLIT